MPEQLVRYVETEVLRIAYLESGPGDGWPVILSHGFPYDVHAYDAVARMLVEAGARVITPYTRGFGPTRFVSNANMRSGQQAARGLDIIQFADALNLERPIVGGYDWGGNASCVAAALWSERIGGLVFYAGYDVIDVGGQQAAFQPSFERICWYQHLFQTERGRVCLAKHRQALCRILWSEWSPDWQFDEATFARSAASYDNPDFVDVVIHSYRHRNGNAPGEPRFAEMERQLAQRPTIQVPSITLHGAEDGIARPAADSPEERASFTSFRGRRIVAGAGHFVPREKPDAVASALLELLAATR